MYFRKKTTDGRTYLQIVESRREGAAPELSKGRQQIIATLGRFDDLQASGQLERLLRSGARFADKAIVLDALNRGEATTIATRRIGLGARFRAGVGGDRLPERDRTPGERAKARLFDWSARRS